MRGSVHDGDLWKFLSSFVTAAASALATRYIQLTGLRAGHHPALRSRVNHYAAMSGCWQDAAWCKQRSLVGGTILLPPPSSRLLPPMLPPLRHIHHVCCLACSDPLTLHSDLLSLGRHNVLVVSYVMGPICSVMPSAHRCDTTLSYHEITVHESHPLHHKHDEL